MFPDTPFDPSDTERNIVNAIGVESATSGSSNRPRKSNSLALGSWLVILLVVTGIAGMVSYSQFMTAKSTEMSAADLIQINLSAKTMVALRQSADETLSALEQFQTGPLEQRYGHAILVNEFAGTGQALEQLAKIDAAVLAEKESLDRTGGKSEFPTESQKEIGRVLHQLFSQYALGNFDTTGITDEDRKLLTEKLGWIGELALIPAQSPNKAKREALVNDGWRSLIVVTIAGLCGILAILAAFAAIAILAGIFFTRQTRVQFKNSDHGFVYLETFAIWLILIFGLQIVIGLVTRLSDNGPLGIVLTPIVFFGSLVALIWPLNRGISWSTLRHDIGWHIRNPVVEAFVGGFSYLALIVPMLFGASITILLSVGVSLLDSTGEFESMAPAAHPITEELASGGLTASIIIILTLCVAAPIVEETMFRGVLYRYFRDISSRQAKWLSVAISSLTSGLIFAMIHPQGIIGVPLLTTLAIGFSLVREWRDSLVGPIVMHAINNGIVTGFLLLLFT